MAEAKISNLSANKMAMSRALGAAFLSHQVEQLEKTVNGPASGNWRDRRQGQVNGFSPTPPTGAKRGPNSPGVKVAPRKKGGEIQLAATTMLAKEKLLPKDREHDRSANASPVLRRRSGEEERREKDADVVVVDASVLVHALYKVKKWCRDGREEIIIVPLEALNTLDLLKKGSSSLAQRARAASRILEAQVGTNPRIRVQRDDAFVLWDKIPLTGDADPKSNPPANTCPEWVRRTICCASWEADNAEEELKNDTSRTKPAETAKSSIGSTTAPKPKVVLAVLSSTPNLSPQSVFLRLSDADPAPFTPVPLPVPAIPAPNKHEPRSAGTLISLWAARAGIELLEVEPTLPGRGGEEDDRPKRAHPHHGGHGGRGRRSSATEHSGKVGLVERPPAVMAMMEMVAQPSKVVRVLARGEKLDPDS